MRNLVTVLVAGLVLASCEPPSEGGTTGTRPPLRTTPGQLSDPSSGSPDFSYTSPCSGSSDYTPPQIALTSPTPGSALSGTVTLTVNATDNVGVSRVNFYLDDRLLLSDTTPPFELVWDSATHGNGPGVFTAQAGDANCNWTTSAPVDVTIENAGIATYDATWAAPACATVGNTCDSADLLEGRGGFGELHQPNTVGGSCADGSIAVGGPTAAVQRLVVSRSDGTALAAGKEVTVQAMVQATASYASQVLDIYVSPEVSNPTWTLVDTLTPPYAVGVWTLSSKYLLPASGRHILRGVYRSTWGGATSAPCPSGDFDDTDDLVIAVGQETDSTPPVVAITSPVEGATLERVVTVTLEASDNFGVSRVELYDGATLIASDSRAPYSLSWATRTVPNGPHTLTARAYDQAGNVSTSAPVHVLLDNDFVPPQVAFITPMDGAIVSQTVSLEASASDDRGTASVSFHVDGVFIGSKSSPPYTVSWNTRGVSNGPHVLGVTAHDPGGNASPPSTVSVVVDNDLVLPQLTLTSPANGATVSGLVSLEAAASDDRGIAEVSFYVDYKLVGRDTTAPYAFSWDSTEVFSGSHTVYAVARDVGGNEKSSQYPYVTVNVSNPVNARYDTALLVPRCDAVAARCDTRDLVKGRAQLSQASEPNTPNTLDGCADGTSGYYLYDEFIDRVRVLREDGTPMTTGKRVRIEVDLRAWDTQYDALDLYYTADAKRSPAWTYLTTVKPTAPGAQTLSAEYILPAGGLQAVRAVLHRGSATAPCSAGSFTDRDDLVFPVGPQEADTVAPDAVVLTAPAPGATVSGSVTVTVSAHDNLGVAAVDFLDGQTLIGTDTQPPYSVSWNSRSGPNGSRTLTARARDLAGNEALSQPVTVTAANDLSVPLVALTAPSHGAQLSAQVELSADATDPEGVTRVEFYKGSTLLGSDSSAPFTWLWNTQNEYVGQYVLTARAYDAAGNVGTSAQVVVSVAPEFTPPTVSLTAPASGARLSKTVTISATATDASGVNRVGFLLDGVEIGFDYSAPYSYSWNTLSAAEGSHTLSARATDIYGNTATSTVVEVTVDNAGPAVVITSPASGGAALTGVVPLTADATDGAGVTRVDFYVDGRLLASDTTAPYGVDWDTRFFTNGNHTLSALARDGLNYESWSAQVTVTTNQPGGAAYDSALRAPKCATPDSVCDTTGLVKGRSTGEPYGGPNTLNASCADGSSYLGPQLTRIKLSSVDGERFAQGGRVQLEVYLIAESLTDELDLFSTGNATSPSWTYLTTLKPGATGDQVLSTEYTLPMGGLQAVRARYRTSSGPKSACGTGGHDHDDVAFVVEVGPTVVLTSPSSNAYVTGVVPLAATATGNQGVARVDFYVDGTLLGTDTNAPYELSWDSTGVAEGAHTLKAKAYGNDGIPTTSPAVVAYIDNTPPDSAALTSPVQGRVVGGNVLLEATASDNVGVARVEFHADGTLIGTDSTAPYALSWNTVGAGEGTHTLTVKALDGAGNALTSEGVWVTVDNTAPVTAITAPAQNALVGGSVQVSATASDTHGVAKVELYVDGTLIGNDTSAPYQVSWSTSGVVEGAHTLTMKAYDTAGNAATSAAVVVNVDSTLPDVALTSPGQGSLHRGTVELAATASDDQGVARVEFYVEVYGSDSLLGTDSTAPYTLSWNTLATSTNNGATTLKAKAFDIAGNVRTSAKVVVTIDNTAPTAGVSTPAYSAHVRGVVPFTAIASDSLGVERVEFYDNGTLIGTDFTAPYVVDWDTTLVPDGHHNLVAKVFDRAGNSRSSGQQPVAVDNSAPVTAISAPAQNAQVRGSVPVSATASDNLGVVKVEFFADGTLLGTLTSAPYVVGWNSTGVADGPYTLTTKAYDKAGNVTTSAAVQVDVDNTLPDVALASPAPGTVLGSTAALEATASDNVGVARVDFYVDGTLIGTATSAPYAVSWSTAGVADGAHTLTVKATDGAGNARTSAGVAVTVDNTAPATALSAPAQNASVRGTVPVSATASDTNGVERVEFYAGGTLLGTATMAPYAVSWDTTALATGSVVTLTTRAYDNAGNVTVSAARTVTVDHTPPTVAITSPANGTSFSFLTFSTTLQASASDNRGVTQVVFYDGASVIGTDTTAPYSVSWNVGSVPNGTHTLTAKAYDAAGNVTTSAPVSVKVN